MTKKTEQLIIEPELLHKKQSLLQVLLPVLLAGAICLGVCLFLVISVASEPQSTEQWAQISTIFLIFPAFFLGLSGLAILVFLVKFTRQWNKSWPPALRNGRLLIINFTNTLQALAQKPARPIIGLKSTWAGILSIFKK